MNSISDSIGRSLPSMWGIQRVLNSNLPYSLAPGLSSDTSGCPNLGNSTQIPFARATLTFPQAAGSTPTLTLCYVSVNYHLGFENAVAPTFSSAHRQIALARLMRCSMATTKLEICIRIQMVLPVRQVQELSRKDLMLQDVCKTSKAV